VFLVTDIWSRPVRGRTARPLDRVRIVATAVELLDADGVEGLTMRALAGRLGAGPSTLYWHVATKDDVLDLALDSIFDFPMLVSGDWRTDVRALVRAWRAAMVDHPWSAALIGRSAIGPNVRERTQHLVTTLGGAGLAEPDLTAATHAIANFVIGSAVTTAAARGHGAEADELFERGLGFVLNGVAAAAG
jgi:AcrR family transcriptional regulator